MALTLAATVLSSFEASASGRAMNGAAPPPAFVVVAANRMAIALGDAAPTSAQYVLARHKAAMHASSGGTGTTNQPIYLIVLTGHFKTGQVGPAPGTIVTGQFASEVLDAKTGRDTDFSIGPKRVSIRSLGLVGNLLPYMHHRATPACSAPDLQAETTFQEATGSALGGITLVNHSGLRCVLPAPPMISLSWRGRTLTVRTAQFPARWLSRMNPRWSHRVTTLTAHGRAQVVQLVWLDTLGSEQGFPADGFRQRASSADSNPRYYSRSRSSPILQRQTEDRFRLDAPSQPVCHAFVGRTAYSGGSVRSLNEAVQFCGYCCAKFAVFLIGVDVLLAPSLNGVNMTVKGRIAVAKHLLVDTA